MINNSRFHGLDSLRGIAAMIVVIHHAQLIVMNDFFAGNLLASYTPLYYLFNGRFAVLFFFALSGFVLALPYFSGRAQPYKKYITKRFCRIYIPFFVLILMIAFLWWVVTSLLAEPEIDWNLWKHDIIFRSIINVVLMTGSNQAGTLNPPIWTLIMEMRVAIIFPILLIFVRKANIVAVILSVISSYIAVKLFTSMEGEGNMYATKSFIGALLLTIYYTQFFVFGIFIAANRDRLLIIVRKFPLWLHLTAFAALLLVPHAVLENII